MAKIFPNRPPQFIIDDPFRSAELKVFKALSDLPNNYRVFYSMHWQNYYPDTGVNEGEADFVIVHPGMGILVLEVKGGAIQYNAERGQWFSQSRDGGIHEIKDPIEQGRRNHYEIKKTLEKLPNWPDRPLNIWHAVCFPDGPIQKGQFFKPDLPREVIIDLQDLKDISTSIDRVFKHCFGAKMSYGAPGQDRMPLIEGLLANSFEIRSPLNVELEKEDEKLIELTEQQFRALSLLGDRKRAAIAGCAGSGKTMLATWKAQQFADLGQKVLLVCFNIALAEDLRMRLQDTIEVYTFHELCLKAAPQVDRGVNSSGNDQNYYEEVLPEALLEAAQEIGRVYDAVIVDEGQDFRENYWIALESLLKEDGYLYIFFDNNQNLFGGLKDLSGLIPEPPSCSTRTAAIQNPFTSWWLNSTTTPKAWPATARRGASQRSSITMGLRIICASFSGWSPG